MISLNEFSGGGSVERKREYFVSLETNGKWTLWSERAENENGAEADICQQKTKKYKM